MKNGLKRRENFLFWLYAYPKHPKSIKIYTKLSTAQQTNKCILTIAIWFDYTWALTLLVYIIQISNKRNDNNTMNNNDNNDNDDKHKIAK